MYVLVSQKIYLFIIKAYFYRLEHIKMHELHRGHEAMHAEMLFILLGTLIVAQIALVEWKKRHNKSYQVLIKINTILFNLIFK